MHKYVIAVDESGAGTLAGPLIVVAVAFPVDAERVTAMWQGIYADKTLVATDSKLIKNASHREALSLAVQATAAAVVIIEKPAAEIDARLFGTVFPEAIRLAAARCIERVNMGRTDLMFDDFLVLVDGAVEKPDLPCDVRCIPGGDAIDWRIGAASLVAKTTHDARMDAIAIEYPGWGFENHRGYPTKNHKTLLATRGPTRAHRKSFNPVTAVMPRAVGIEE